MRLHARHRSYGSGGNHSGGGRLQYEASQWYTAYDPDIRGAAMVRQNSDGTLAGSILFGSIEPGIYLFRIVVPVKFRQLRLGGPMIPWTWTTVNACTFGSGLNTSGCNATGLGTSDLGQYLSRAVVEVWTYPIGRHEAAKKWASAPLFAED